MKRTRSAANGLALLTVAALLAAVAPKSEAQKMYALPTNSDSVDKAVSAENLTAVASKATDPKVLLGLAFLAPVGSPARPEISEMAVKAKPEYAPVVALLAVAMDGIDEKSVGELMKRDPNNALGYYLQGNLLYQSGKEKKALENFRKAAACSELRLYESTTGEALIKAVDALNLQGLDRLCALSWMATRSSNFNSIALQPLKDALWELARHADIGTRKEISDLLLVLAGHLYITDFHNRWFAERALERSFQLKAEVAFAEKSPTTNGYVAVVRAVVSTTPLDWPGIEEHRTAPLELARFLPNRIYEAFSHADPSRMNMNPLIPGEKVNVPDSEKAAFEKAKENLVNAAKALIDVALTDPEGILGAYLKGSPPPRADQRGPWVSQYTFVESLMLKRPDVFRAAATYEQAMDALYKAGEGDPLRRNMSRMMEIGTGIFGYAYPNKNTCPDSLAILFEKKYLEPPLEAKSLLTGRPYVYVAAGEKLPEKSKDRERFILFYDDDTTHQDGYYFCIFADGHGSAVLVDKVMEQLKAQGK